MVIAVCPEHFFRQASTEARAAMAMVKDSSDVLALLLSGGHNTIAGRLAGAFRNAGRDHIADQIIGTMKAAGFTMLESDPFGNRPPNILERREASPYVNRIRLMWQKMRVLIIERFPPAPGLPKELDSYLKHAEEIYVTDAYHSLSIEGYRVNAELLELVQSGAWNPENNKNDREHRNALAARGCWQAYQAVQESLSKILHGENSGTVVGDDHNTWYAELFGPSVTAGIINAVDLAGYRSDPVYIRRSMHIPPPREAVRNCMPALFDLLKEEPEPPFALYSGILFLSTFIPMWMAMGVWEDF